MKQINLYNFINILPFLFLVGFIILKSIGILLSVIAILIIREFKSNVEDFNKIDYAIVLGAGLDGDQISNRLKKRLDKAYEVLKNSSIPIIVSGGQGPDELVTESYAMAEYLINKGIQRKRVIQEDQSTSTQENLLFSLKYIEKNKANLLIITSDYHMFRAKMLGKRLNHRVQGISAKSSREKLPKQFIREMFAVLKDLVIRKF